MILFGKTLKHLRKSHGLTQQELADRLQLSQSQIKNWETDRFQPDIETLISIATFFDVSLDALVGYQSDFNDKPLQDLIFDAQVTYAALDERQRERFCKQASLFIKMLAANQNHFD